MRRVSGALAVVAATCVFLSPATATATVTCGFDSGSGLVTVNMGQATDFPELRVGIGANVVVSGTGVPNPGTCSGLPETNKVSRIDVVQPGASQDGQVAIHTDTPFAPGAGDPSEGSGAAELEIRVDLGGGSDMVDLMMGDGSDSVRLGALPGGGAGIDLNVGAEAAAPDGDDVSMVGVESIGIFAGAGGGGDVIDGRGGAEFVAALPLPLGVAGSEGDDDLSAGAGGSVLAGNGGNDTLRGGAGNDTLRGNGGRDVLVYDGAPGGVTINLTADTPQNTGAAGFDTLDREGGPSPDIEDLIGSPFADILIGSDTANLIVGGDGVDTIAALDGADDVRVDDGVEGDSADCGPGADSAAVDALGTVPLDRATDCEALALTDRTPPAQPESPGPSPQPSGGSTGAGGESANGNANVNPRTAPDLTPPTLRLSLKKKQRVGRLTVRVTCLDEACTVRGAGLLRTAGAAKKRRLPARPLRLAEGATGTLRFKLARPTKQAARLALRRGKWVSATITVRASDAAGNTATKRRALKLR